MFFISTVVSQNDELKLQLKRFQSSPTIAPPTSPKAMATHVPAAWKPPWVPSDLSAYLPSRSNVLINLKRRKRKTQLPREAKSDPFCSVGGNRLCHSPFFTVDRFIGRCSNDGAHKTTQHSRHSVQVVNPTRVLELQAFLQKGLKISQI